MLTQRGFILYKKGYKLIIKKKMLLVVFTGCRLLIYCKRWFLLRLDSNQSMPRQRVIENLTKQNLWAIGTNLRNRRKWMNCVMTHELVFTPLMQLPSAMIDSLKLFVFFLVFYKPWWFITNRQDKLPRKNLAFKLGSIIHFSSVLITCPAGRHRDLAIGCVHGDPTLSSPRK